jgi:UDP-glucose 4-epimerase
MRCVVTGAAGFIGSHLAGRLAAAGHEVTGVDCFTSYYSRALKERNLKAAGKIRFVEIDLVRDSLDDVVADAEVIYHLAAQPGVLSFGPGFAAYIDNNITGTHRLLDAAHGKWDLRRAAQGAGSLRLMVYASSASVYGSTPLPMAESGPAKPVSPYGITKLAAEQLCLQYSTAGLVPAMALRFFNVFGPRQRPDMAFTRLAVAMLAGREFPLRGTGEQERDFTAVDDVVDVLVACLEKGKPGLLLNVGGGHRISLMRAIQVFEKVGGKPAKLKHEPEAPGEMSRMEADTTALRKEFGFSPRVKLEDALERQLAWARDNLDLLAS